MPVLDSCTRNFGLFFNWEIFNLVLLFQQRLFHAVYDFG
ncbi:hypothetical protein NSP_41350 [Nodularia spumigena CCY9414]|nr:hypothetical protein NSP_41350 [Nodularia spumigena CCY9414]